MSYKVAEEVWISETETIEARAEIERLRRANMTMRAELERMAHDVALAVLRLETGARADDRAGDSAQVVAEVAGDLRATWARCKKTTFEGDKENGS